MIFDLKIFTQVHVAITLVAIASGFIVMFGLLTGRRLNRWTALFLLMTLATDVTGFLFPFHGFTPAIGVGIVSLLVLAITLFARYARHLAGGWRVSYVIGPDGSPLTLADLPPPSTRRWVIRRKAEVVAAVRGGLLSLDDACKRYTLTVEEFLAWQHAIDRFGLAGLRATRVQQYRN